MDNHIGGVICISLLVAFLAIMGTIWGGVTSTNKLYYDTMNRCIANGGSWIPLSGGNGYNAMCQNKA